MRYTLITILLLATARLATGAPVKGIVKDLETGEELIGATVAWKEHPSRGTRTGLDGSFALEGVEGAGTLVCRHVGYETLEVAVTGARAGLTIRLKPVARQIDGVVVHGAARRDSDAGARGIERLSASVMNVVSANAIEASPDITVANVARRVSGVTIELNSSGDGQYAILRGMDKRYSYTLVNGIKIPSPDNKNRFVPLDIFPSELLDRLEVTKTLTADMEGDAAGGAVNLVMKEAPRGRQVTANVSTGYNALFLHRDFYSFDAGAVAKRSPYEVYGEDYPARARDFSGKVITPRAGAAPPNLFAGFSYGDRLFGSRLGVMLAGSFQNAYRGSNSLYFNNGVATSDASNLPVLTAKNEREYSERQTRLGLHARLDYALSPRHKLHGYAAYMRFANAQVRDNVKTELNIGYDPAGGNYNLGFDTRFRLTRQRIASGTLKGVHYLLPGEALRVEWSAVYSGAFNEAPDNSTVYTSATVRDGQVNAVSVVTTPYGAERRWERNDDEDLAGYLNARYALSPGAASVEVSAGGMYRDKRRANFYNDYLFLPFDEEKPSMNNNLIRGTDWNDYGEIKFRVHNPYGSTGNQLNYAASEEIAAAHAQVRWQAGRWQVMLGARVENTRQGYRLKHAIEGVKNEGEQRYADYLPGLHVKFSPWRDHNVRASYYKSLNRPGFFEIVPYQILNEEYTERGNPGLKHATIHNADFRYEYFPRPSEQFMIGVFYKLLRDPIEYGVFAEGQGTYYSPTNFGDATNRGVEVDVTKYFHSFGVKANYTFTRSEITTTKLFNYANPDAASTERILVKNVEQTRPLNGQAAHVANLSLLYKDARRGWDGQLALSYTGDRLHAVSRHLDDDIWQGAYLQVDASLEKRFRPGLVLFAKASNLLDAPVALYLKKHNPANDKVVGHETFRGGTLARRDYHGQNLQVGLRYKF